MSHATQQVGGERRSHPVNVSAAVSRARTPGRSGGGGAGTPGHDRVLAARARPSAAAAIIYYEVLVVGAVTRCAGLHECADARPRLSGPVSVLVRRMVRAAPVTDDRSYHPLDHLLCVRALLKAEQLFMAAPYTLMRAALENASVALWLLAPADPVERRCRKLFIELDDAKDSVTARALTDQPPQKMFEQRQAELLLVADRANVPRGRLVGRRPGWSAKVREAGSASGVGADRLEFTWRWLSPDPPSRDVVTARMAC